MGIAEMGIDKLVLWRPGEMSSSRVVHLVFATKKKFYNIEMFHLGSQHFEYL